MPRQETRRQGLGPGCRGARCSQWETGPFDGDSVDITQFDFSDFANGVLNLGSMQLPLPKSSQVQVKWVKTARRCFIS